MIPRKSNHGFTLVEIMIVVVIIGLIAAIAIPTFRAIRSTTHATTTASEFRTFVGALERFAFENRGWPADTAPGVIPPGMEGYFAPDKFTGTSPIGGNWDWQFQQGSPAIEAALAITDPTISEPFQVRIDQLLDDGDLTTGRFQKIGNSLTFIIQEEE